MGVPEGNIQIGAEHPLVPHQAQKRHGGGQLQYKFLQRRQPGVVVVLYLLIVVDIADDAEHQGEQVYIQVDKAACHHVFPAQHHDGQADADDEHQTAHGRRTLLRHVPRRADLLDGLARLQLHQCRYQQLARDDGDDKADNDRQRDLHKSHNCLLLPAAGRAAALFICSDALPR